MNELYNKIKKVRIGARAQMITVVTEQTLTAPQIAKPDKITLAAWDNYGRLSVTDGGVLHQYQLPYDPPCPLICFDTVLYNTQKGSWLNMAEIEFAALAKQSLARYITTFDTLQCEAVAWADQHNLERKTVNWTFSQNDARSKLQRHYKNIKKFI